MTNLVSSTEVQLVRVRQDLDLPDGVPPDPDLDDLYTRSIELYGTNNAAVEARVRIFLIRRLLAGAARSVDYVANTSQFKRSDWTKHLRDILKDYQSDLEEAVGGAESPAVMWGSMSGAHAYLSEYPDDYSYPDINNTGVLPWWK